MPPGDIPSELLPFISVTEDIKPIYKEGNLSIESIFDVFANLDIKYTYLMAPVSMDDEETMTKAISATDNNSQIIFVQFSDADGFVHQVGVESKKRREIIRRTDDRIKKLKEKIEQKFENP